MIKFGDYDFKNDGKTIWDGEKLIDLEKRRSKYRCCPTDFQIDEFPSTAYFTSMFFICPFFVSLLYKFTIFILYLFSITESISHTEIVWLDLTHYKILQEKLAGNGLFST